MKHGDPRPTTVGAEGGPEAPYPLRLEGPVVQGFGRGSKELGIPTANIPISGLNIAGHSDLRSGVYLGYCSLTDTPAPDTNPFTGEKVVVDAAANPNPNPNNASQAAPVASNPPDPPRELKVYEMVMSIGWNPYYKNSKRSVEIHVMHDFKHDFYGVWMRVLILEFVREELDYVSKEALIEDIRTDIEVTRRSLGREKWRSWEGEAWLRGKEGRAGEIGHLRARKTA